MAFLTMKKAPKASTTAAETVEEVAKATEVTESAKPNSLEEIMLERCKNDSNFLHWFYPEEGTYILIRKDKKGVLEIKDVKAFSNWYSIDGILYAKVRRKSTSKAGLIKCDGGKLVELLPSVFENINISADGLLTAETEDKIIEYPLKKETSKGPIKVNSIADIISAASVTP